MPSLKIVRESNLQLRKGTSEFVAVIAGATSGIGEATCKELARHVSRPTIYLIGRNETRANAIITELKAVNSTAQAHFVQTDLALLKNVDDVCKQINEKEGRINLLFLTANVLQMSRSITSEGLEQMMALQYYSRVRFIINLLSSLQSAASQGELARVISVLGAGKEGKIFQDDLLLERNFSLPNCASQAICMTSLTFARLAEANPMVSFLHVSPGVVRGTGITSGFDRAINTVSRVLMTLAAPFTVSVKESGERHLYISTNDAYEPGHAKSPLRLFRLDWDGESCRVPELLSQYLHDGTQDKVWSHATDVYKRICEKSND